MDDLRNRPKLHRFGSAILVVPRLIALFAFVFLFLLLSTQAGLAQRRIGVDTPGRSRENRLESSIAATPRPFHRGGRAVRSALVGQWRPGPRGRCEAVVASGDLIFFQLGRDLLIADLSEPTNPRILSETRIGTRTQGSSNYAIAVSGSSVYASDVDGLWIYDATNPEAPVLVGSLPLQGGSYELAAAGDRLYVANNYHGLRMIDVSDPTAPVEVGSIENEGNVLSVAARDQYVYLSGPYGMVIYDVTDPVQPERLGSAAPGPQAIALSGDLAYLTGGRMELMIVDISDPRRPVTLGIYAKKGNTLINSDHRGIAVRDGRVYATDATSGALMVFDVADTGNPKKLAYFGGSINGRDLVAGDGIVYVADERNGLRIIDVSDLTPMSLIARLDTPGDVMDLELSGTTAVVADGASGLRILDLSSPSTPTEIGAFEQVNDAVDVEVSGDLVYLGDSGFGLRVISVADPANPVEIATFPTATDVQGVTLADGRIYLTSWVDDLRIIDVTAPGSLLELGTYPAHAGGPAAIWNEHAYLVQYSLRILNVSDPSAVSEVFDFPVSMPRGISVENDLAYLAPLYETNWKSSLRLLDVEDPAAPVDVGAWSMPSRLTGVELSGTDAYVLGLGGAFWSIDCSDPRDPRETRYYDAPGRIWNAAISGGLAALALGQHGIEIVDPAGASSPSSIGDIFFPGRSNDIVLKDRYAFLADGAAGLRVLDLTAPTDPVEIGRAEIEGVARALTLSGDVSYVAGSSGVTVMDISVPESPVTVGHIEVSDGASDVAVSGSRIYVIEVGRGLEIYDVADPANPVLEGISWGFDFRGIAISGNHAFVPRAYDLVIMDISDPANPTTVTIVQDYVTNITTGGGFAYACGFTGMTIYDIANPADPRVVATRPAHCGALALAADRLFLSETGTGLIVLDVSTPSSPIETSGPLQMGGAITAISADEVLALVAEGDDGLEIVRHGNHPPEIECLSAPFPNDPGSCSATLPCDAIARCVDPDEDVLSLACAPEGPFPVGMTDVAVTCSDGLDDVSRTCIVVVEDSEPPIVTCPIDTVLECSSSSDPALVGAGTASDNCGVESLTYADAFESSCGGAGTLTRTWSATDGAMLESRCEQEIETMDTIPPEIDCRVSLSELWPPNHGMVEVGYSVVARDRCDPTPVLDDPRVTIDEAPGTLRGSPRRAFCPDALVTNNGAVLLRAERDGAGDGRVYEISVRAGDGCGNTSFCSAFVSVPKGQGENQAAVDSGQTFDPDCE